MALLTSTSGVGGILPEDYGDLIVKPVSRDSLAYQLSTVVQTGANEMHIPILDADPAAAFVAEGAEITPDDVTLDEAVVKPAKVAGLSIVSRELANDSSPAAQNIIGQAIARDMIRAIDAAFFGTWTDGPEPKGLGNITATEVTGDGEAYADLDLFEQAILNAETNGTPLTAFVTSKATAKSLLTLKDESGSNRPLLGVDATSPTRRTILGVPLFVSPHVEDTDNLVWGIPQSRSLVIQREGAELAVDRSVYFTSDRIAIRGIMRLTFAFPDEAAIQKITTTASE
ncbi:MAG UNVERIFIED_CONTAM: phage major capsid protein [Thermobifida fusca]